MFAAEGSCTEETSAQQEKEKVDHTCQRRPGSNRKQKAEKNRRKQAFGERTDFVSEWRMTWKEKTSPQRWRFRSNCIGFKVQQFMYRNTAVSASAPRRKQEQKKGTNSGEEREQKQNTE